MFLALVLGVVSCQTEPEGFDVNMGGEQEVLINVSLPEETRADSAEGGITNVIASDDYTIRYIFQVYNAKGDEFKAPVYEYTDDTSVAFPVRLVPGRDYRFVVWADIVEKDTKADLHYNTAYFPAISLNQTWVAMDETRDAYTVSELVTDFHSGKAITLTLKRPLAKLRVITTDMAELLGLKPEYATVTYSTSHYNTFDALNSVVGDNKISGCEHANYTIKDDYEATNGKVLFTDYFFADNEVVKFNMSVKMSDEGTVDRSFTTDIPVKRNHLTTIMGDILTDGNNIVVKVEEGFEQPENLYEIWDGLSVSEPAIENDPVSGEPVGVIDSAADLAWLAQYVNGTIASTFATRGNEVMNFVLKADIDLNNQPWIGIGTEENNFVGTFNGNGHKIANLNLVETEAKEGKAFIGFFGYAKNATIKNLTFENVNINIPCLDIDHSQGHIGAVAGSLEGTSTIENVTVKGDIKVEATVTANGASRVAVVAGGNSYGNVTMKNVHVIANEGSYLKANNNVGALAGQLQGVSVFENCSSNIDVTGTKFFAGGIIGLAAGDQTFTNCHTTGNITITAGREGKAHDHYRVGGIAGGWADGAKNVCTLTNCSYTGELSGTNADGSVAEAFDYAGYVGRGYTLNGCKGSKVVIDGVEYVQAYNTANEAGIYYVNGELTISTAATLKAFANMVNNGTDYFEGETVKLGADIDLKGMEWTPIGSASKDHGFMGNFDGNGKTIKNLNITNIALDADGYAYAGLFGVTEGVDANNENWIKNLTIENVNIKTTGHIVAAAVAYPYYTALENITVKGNVSIEGGDYTSGVLAYTRRCVDAKNIAIEANNGVIKGNMTIGGVISDIQMNGGLTANYSNFAASGLTIEGVMHVGGISGILSKQTLNGATVKNVAIVCDDARKGIVSGSLGEDATLNNVVVNNVTGADYYVGATYKAGSTHTLVVDGVVYEYLANGQIKVDGNIIIANGVILNEAGEYIISNAAGMFWFANEVNVNGNGFSGKTVKLAADINLENAEWTPVGQTGATTFNGVFDGQNYTISNLNVNSEAQTGAHYSSGLFGWVESHTAGHGHLKNVKIEGATINGHHNCGALVGYITQETALVENCHVTGATVTCTKANNDADGDKAGALIGNATVATPVNNCTAANSTVSAGRDAGQVIGTGKEANVTGCSATNVTVSANGTGTGANVRNEVIGRLL